MDVIEELKFLGKFTKKINWEGGGGDGGWVGGGGGGGGGGWTGGGGGGGGGVGLGGVWMDVNEELNFFVKTQKKKIGGGGEVGGGG